MGGGNYARFWKDKSPVFIGGVVVFGVLGGLTGFCADGGSWIGGGGGEGRLVAPPSAALRPSAER